jgi:hypothetical protein
LGAYCIFINKFCQNFKERVHFYPPCVHLIQWIILKWHLLYSIADISWKFVDFSSLNIYFCDFQTFSLTTSTFQLVKHGSNSTKPKKNIKTFSCSTTINF